MARLIWSPRAVDDLEAACEYIARDSLRYAADFARRVVDAVAMLRRHQRRGRAVAARLGLRLVGLLGSLIEAKRRGLIRVVRPVVDERVHDAGFRVSESL